MIRKPTFPSYLCYQSGPHVDNRKHAHAEVQRGTCASPAIPLLSILVHAWSCMINV